MIRTAIPKSLFQVNQQAFLSNSQTENSNMLLILVWQLQRKILAHLANLEPPSNLI